MKTSSFFTGILALTCLSRLSAFSADVVVNELKPTPASPSVDDWYQTDIRFGGTATIQDLTGSGGNLENNEPLPSGAAHLTTTANNSDAAEVGTFNDFGSAVSVLKNIELGYSYFKSSPGDPAAAAAPALKLSITGPGTGDIYGQLIYEPYWNGAVTPGTVTPDSWTAVSIDQDSGSGGNSGGGWWWTGGYGIGGSAGGPPLRSLSEWADALSAADPQFADAHVTGLFVGVGSYNPNQNDYFDAVSIKTGGIDKTYDFQAASAPDSGTTLGLLGLSIGGMYASSRRGKK